MTSPPSLRWQASPGTAQKERLPAALDPDYFRVDEQGLPDLVEISATAARRLKFVDLRSQSDGHWGRWFENDEGFILARIAGIDVERWETDFLRIVEDSTAEGRVPPILTLAERIDDWYRALKVLDRPASKAVCAQIQRLVERRLGGELAWTYAQAPESSAVRRLMEWTSVDDKQQAMGANGGQFDVRRVFFSFLDVVTQLKKLAAEQLPATLASDSHEPSAALFLAFLQLYGIVQQRINEFTPRHTDFYYRDCLYMVARPAEPDSVHLVCRRVPTADLEVIVPERAAFVLRNASGREIVYRANEAVDVTPIQVAALHTLRLERDKLISPEHELNYVARAKAQRLPVSTEDTFARLGRPYWPLFGGSTRRAGQSAPLDADLGIAITSPLLFLREGKREVRVRLCFAHPADVDEAAAGIVREFKGLKSTEQTHLASADDRRAFPEMLARIFLRFAQIDRKAEAKAETDDEAALFEMAYGEVKLPQKTLELAAPRIATNVFVRRLQALTKEKTEQLRRHLAASKHKATVRSAFALSGELQTEIRDEVRKVLASNIDVKFETPTPVPVGIQFVVDGIDRLPGEALEMALQAALRIVAQRDQRSGYDLRTLYSSFLVQRLLKATEPEFYELFGRLFCRWMLIDPEALSDGDVQAIKKRLGELKPEKMVSPGANSADVLSCIQGKDPPKRELIIGKFFREMLDVSLTAPDGWFSLVDSFVLSDEPSGAEKGKDLRIVCRLPREAPPIVAYDAKTHGGRWQTTLPALRLLLKPGSTPFCYSLLADVVLTAIHVSVDVEGARDLLLHNNLGRLDPSKPFNPFGPLPSSGSYLVIGSDEAARKNIKSLKFQIDWGNLPQDDGGFRVYYRAYETDFRNQGVKVSTAILCDGQWEPADRGNEQALFTASPDDRNPDDHRVRNESTVEIDGASLRNYFRPTRGASAEEVYGYDLATRSGFFKLSLAEPLDTFGHKQYPQLLTKVLSSNAKRRRPLPMPNAPYTPVIERLTFDYEANASMNLAHEDPVERRTSDDQVFLIHPFGFEEIYPAIQRDSKGPIPRLAQDGNLFIGLAGERTPGRVTLFFSLRDESARRVADAGPKPRISWYYLASNRWRPLAPAHVASDSTRGFLTSGIVTLDIPADIDRANTILSSDLYWLCVGVETGFERFADLYGVQAQALHATRELTQAMDPDDSAPPAGTVAEPLVSIPGLISAVQMGDAFGGRAAESTEQFKTRVGERLRHKNRASTPWDYERLVLERFPNVFQVKCFSTIGGRASAPGPQRMTAAPRPGCVTLVVVPTPQPGVLEELRAPKLNAVELEQIKEYVGERASPFAEIVVRNAIYERIHVQCAVRFKKAEQRRSGFCLQRMNAELAERISPWRPGGVGARFDWILRKEEVEAWIRQLDYVDFVSEVSLLQISEDDNSYFVLGDSARSRGAEGESPGGAGDATGPSHTLRARFPWSIAIPARDHTIKLMTGAPPAEAKVTGIEGLEVGNTFIVGVGDG